MNFGRLKSATSKISGAVPLLTATAILSDFTSVSNLTVTLGWSFWYSAMRDLISSPLVPLPVSQYPMVIGSDGSVQPVDCAATGPSGGPRRTASAGTGADAVR